MSALGHSCFVPTKVLGNLVGNVGNGPQLFCASTVLGNLVGNVGIGPQLFCTYHSTWKSRRECRHWATTPTAVIPFAFCVHRAHWCGFWTHRHTIQWLQRWTLTTPRQYYPELRRFRCIWIINNHRMPLGCQSISKQLSLWSLWGCPSYKQNSIPLISLRVSKLQANYHSFDLPEGVQATSKNSPMISLRVFKLQAKIHPSDLPEAKATGKKKNHKKKPFFWSPREFTKISFLWSPLEFSSCKQNIIPLVSLKLVIKYLASGLIWVSSLQTKYYSLDLNNNKTHVLTDLSMSLAHCWRVKRRSRSKL